MTRDRERKAIDPKAIPKDWPNGSGLYRQGTGHLKDESGLIGRSFRRGDKFPAWRWHKLLNKYIYLGEFSNHTQAQAALSGKR